MDRCLYLESVHDNYWYCTHLEYEREYPDCTDCKYFINRQMLRALRAEQDRGEDYEM